MTRESDSDHLGSRYERQFFRQANGNPTATGAGHIVTPRLREGIVTDLDYCWSREFLQAGKKPLKADTRREVTSKEVSTLRKGRARLEELVAETVLENRASKDA